MIFHLLSGGEDSSYSLYLLQKNKLNLFCIILDFLKSKENIKRAIEVCRILRVPFLVLNIKKIFEREVILPFVEDFKKGLTPNPCPFCNKKIKFDFVFGFLKKFFEKKTKNFSLSTGHYARKKGNFIYKAKDKKKDQSYFLWTLQKEDIKHLIFPLGEKLKKEVEKEILKTPLKPLFQQYKPSQDVCFLENFSLTNFLEKKIKKKEGFILNEEGKKIGKHPGVMFFSLGQRYGLNIPTTQPSQKPFYVIKKDPQKNILIVGPKEKLYKKEFFIEKAIFHENPKKEIFAKIRSQGEEVKVKKLTFEKNKIKVILEKKVFAPTPGQHCVFYQKEKLIGGGVISD